MSNPIRHHHVPQTYLKNFSFKKKEQFKIYTFDRNSKKIFEANVLDVAVEKNFYTVKKCKDNYAWENFYAQSIEPIMGNVISKIIGMAGNCLIQENTHILDNEVKSELAIIMVSQLLRGKQGREFEQKIFDDVAPEIIHDVKSKFIGKGNDELDVALENYKISEDIFKISAMQATLDIERLDRISSFIFHRCWVVYKIIGKREFVTSDNPVMFMNGSSLDVTPFHNGIADNKTIVFFPISPKLMIGVYAYDFYLGALNSCEGCLLFIDSEKDKRFIVNANQKQSEQCHRQAFSHSQETLKELF